MVGGGYTGMWTAWHLLQAEPSAQGRAARGRPLRARPERAQRGLLRVDVVSARTPLRERFGDGPARALLDAGEPQRHGDRRVVRRERASTRGSTSRATSASPRRPPSTTPAAPRCAPRPSSAAPSAVQELSAEQVRARCDSPVFRRGVFVPDFATVQPARLALGLRATADRARRADLRGLARVASCSGDRGGVVARTDRRLGAGGRRGARHGPALARHRRPLRSRLTVTSSHIVHDRAGAGPARGDRLDRRRVHHGRPPAPALLPHHAATGASCSAGAAAGSPAARA